MITKISLLEFVPAQQTDFSFCTLETLQHRVAYWVDITVFLSVCRRHTLQMEAVCTFETFLITYQTARCYNQNIIWIFVSDFIFLNRIKNKMQNCARPMLHVLCFEMQLLTAMSLLLPCGLCGSGGLPEQAGTSQGRNDGMRKCLRNAHNVSTYIMRQFRIQLQFVYIYSAFLAVCLCRCSTRPVMYSALYTYAFFLFLSFKAE